MRHRGGVAAVEFALILPIMIFLFVGIAQLSQAVAVKRKVAITTHTVTDLVTQYTTLQSSDVDSILSASSAVVAPYSTSNLVLVVSEISTDSTGKATVTWSRTMNGTALQKGQVVTLPVSITQPNMSYIFGQALYNYTPILGYTIVGTIPLSDYLYMSPRSTGSIPCSSC
jgi:Flp pilus assembly protein TadG